MHVDPNPFGEALRALVGELAMTMGDLICGAGDGGEVGGDGWYQSTLCTA